jgi:glycosyltransferase involved in cell wall biosynthesis
MPPSGTIWVVIAAYNEASAIADVVGDVTAAGYRAVVVDDGSHDRTAEVAESAGAALVRHPINLGQGAALQTGIEFALARGANTIVTFDADGQHRAADIPGLVEALARHDADFALGSRFLGTTVNMPGSRRWA